MTCWAEETMCSTERSSRANAKLTLVLGMPLPSNEISINKEHDKLDPSPENLLTAQEMTRYRSGHGRRNDATNHERAKSIERKLKICGIPINHSKFMRVHDAAHDSNEGGASQQAHVIMTVHMSRTEQNRTEQSRAEQSREEQSRAEQNGTERNGT